MKIISILATFSAASLLALSPANASDHDRRDNSGYHESEQRNYDNDRSHGASTDARNAASILGYALSHAHRGSYGHRSSGHHGSYGYNDSYSGRGYQNRGYRGNRGYSSRGNRSYRGGSYRRGY